MPRKVTIAGLRLAPGLPFVCGMSALAQPASLPPPIELAAQGEMQCYSPDPEKKTCQSMAAYYGRADGVIENTAWVLMPTSTPIVMEVTSEATVREGKVCGKVLIADLDKAFFRVDGEDLPPDLTARYRVGVRSLYAATLEREVCTAYAPDGAGFLAEITVDGELQVGSAMRVIWVSLSDGYHVGR